jgi:hypothetical protein
MRWVLILLVGFWSGWPILPAAADEAVSVEDGVAADAVALAMCDREMAGVPADAGHLP